MSIVLCFSRYVIKIIQDKSSVWVKYIKVIDVRFFALVLTVYDSLLAYCNFFLFCIVLRLIIAH